MTMDAKAIRAGPTTTFSPIATIVFLVPHAMILDCDAINKPDKFIINHKKVLLMQLYGYLIIEAIYLLLCFNIIILLKYNNKNGNKL
jgi:hypothetical protein